MRYRFAALLMSWSMLGQVAAPVPPRPAVLEIEVDKIQFYWRDSTVFSEFAASGERVPGSIPRNFPIAEGIGDIVAVNGIPVKGTMTAQISGLIHNIGPAATPGVAIADTRATGRIIYEFDIWSLDDQQIGTIYATGLNNTPLPPGAPPRSQSLNLVITGGTGAFLGVRGQMQHSFVNQASPGAASIREDPSLRRTLYSGRGFSFNRLAHLIPWKTPEIDAVLHGDFQPVTPANPAKPGETLILRARGLGPTRPGAYFGKPFPLDLSEQVNGPISAFVNGQKAAVVNAFGWPGEMDLYRVDIVLPSLLEAGELKLSLESAWIPGSEIKLPVMAKAP